MSQLRAAFARPFRRFAPAVRLIAHARLVRVFGLVSAFAIAAYAQHLLSDAGSFGQGWPLLSELDRKLTDFYRKKQSVAFAIPLFFAAMLLFALSVRATPGWRMPDIPDPLRTRWQVANRTQALLALGAVFIIGVWAYLIVRLARGQYSTADLGRFFTVLIAGTVLCGVIDRQRRSALRLRIHVHLWEVALLAVISGIFIGLTVNDLTNWRYAWIGDEGDFISVARTLLEHPDQFNLLGQHGVYGIHPPMTSGIQALIMRFAGDDVFGWKLGSVLIIAAVIPAYYAVVKMAAGTRAAVFAAIMLSFSHYLYAYARTGYNNAYALFPAVLSFALLFGGLQTGSLACFFASGAAAGLGFYTFFSARLSIGIVLVTIVFMGRKHWQLERIAALLSGFTLAVVPIWVVSKTEVFTAGSEQSAFHGRSFSELVPFLLHNTPFALLVFNYNPFPLHYTYGSLLDDVTAVLALLGLALCVARSRHEGARFFVIWFVLGIIATGILDPAPTSLASRVGLVLPAMVAFAAIAIDASIALLSSFSSSPLVERALTAVCLIFLMPAVLAMNSYHFWHITPGHERGPAQGLIYREATGPHCKGNRGLVIAEGGESVVVVFDRMGRKEEAPFTLRFTDPTSAVNQMLAVHQISCIFVTPDFGAEAEPFVTTVLALASERGYTTWRLSDPSGLTKVLVADLEP